jgi:hypothetical protein
VLEVPGGTKYWLILKEEHYQFALFCGNPSPNLGAEDMGKLLQIDREIELRTIPGSRVTGDESISFAGFPGRQVEIQGSADWVCLIRVYLVRQGSTKRLYKLLVAGSGLQADSGIAARFFDSFQLDATKPPPAAKEQKEARPR